LFLNRLFKVKNQNIDFLAFCLDSGQSNERLGASSNQSGPYRQTTMNALEERESQEDAQMLAEELGSDEEVKYFSIITYV